ncbi:MAG: resolvase [Planctomycetota bacterium]|nr:MAG: resolvase [Planctomycetota bacterium]
MRIEAAGYCRVSGKGQQNTGTGLDRQEETVKAYAKQADYKLTRVYSEAFTGTETERPVFEEMLADLLDNGCRVIIVECLDRLARDLAVQLQIIALLANKGITLINAMTGQDVTAPSDPMSKAMIQVQGTFAELDKNLLVRKLKKGRQTKKKKDGYCEGQKAFGYRPGEQGTVDRIKQLYRKKPGDDRLSCHKIAKVLNREKRPTRHGGQWGDGQVRAILKRLNILK